MLNERQEYIVDQLQDAGQVQVDALAAFFQVTTQTIRRDLGDLCDRGLAARTHGGARRLVSTAMVAYEDRRTLSVDVKRLIALRAAELIPNKASVALNIGTTTEQVAAALRLHKDLMVVTNNVNVVHILRDSPLKSLNIIGGEVRRSDGAIVGSEALQAIRNYKVDYAIIGASCLDVDGSVLDFDQREVAVARAILTNARTRILVCDHSKFDVSASHRICDVGELDFVVTDAAPPEQFERAALGGGAQVIIAETSDGRAEHQAL